MALSYYSNWEPSQQLNSEPTIIDQLLSQTELTQDYNQLQAFPDYQLFDPDDLFCSSENLNFDHLLQDDFSSGFLFDNSNNNHPLIDPFTYPELNKSCDYEQLYPDDQFMNKPAFVEELVQNPNYPTLHDYCKFSPSETFLIPPTLPDFPTGPPSYSNGSFLKNETTAAAGGGSSVSAQSVAARQRRRKITEKTQELGKLVPGGQKMNTAEMFQAAYKYIKFLQAQVGILEFIATHHQENREVLESDEDLQVLLESPMVQEKLYSAETCLVPQKFVQEISSDHQLVQSNPQLLSIVKQEH